MGRKLISLQDMVGKTVEKVWTSYDGDESEDVAIMLTDGTVCVLAASNGYDGCPAEVRLRDSVDIEHEHALAIGAELATEAEIKAISDAQMAKHAEFTEQYLRQQYESLKKRFGDA